jgi:hypothetical protein
MAHGIGTLLLSRAQPIVTRLFKIDQPHMRFIRVGLFEPVERAGGKGKVKQGHGASLSLPPLIGQSRPSVCA